ncbi:hypothetical protein C5C24_15675 [Rathayibacter sp. AY2B3]|nr:hypothetical protein C5C24_15675 [Rathayibacter sp. AY2B3]
MPAAPPPRACRSPPPPPRLTRAPCRAPRPSPPRLAPSSRRESTWRARRGPRPRGGAGTRTRW